MRYKAVLFDLDNTLLNYESGERKSMRHTVEKYGLMRHEAFSWERFLHLYGSANAGYWNGRRTSGHTIHQVLEYSFRDALQELRLDSGEYRRLAELYWGTFCGICDFETYAAEAVQQLHGRYKLAIISNGIGEAQRGRLAAGGIRHLFDTLVVSDEVGLWKPDRAIFDETLRRLGVDRSEALFVGDSLQDDYAGAVNAGIDFCYYNRRGEPVGSGIRPTYTIDSLSRIGSLLAR